MLRFEAIVHNTRALHTGRALEKFPEITARLAGMVDRFTSMLDCVDIGFLADGLLDELPKPSQIGATRVGGVDVNKPRTRAALAAVLALAIAPEGFTVAEYAAKVRALTGQDLVAYTIRQAAYDLRKLRGRHLIVKPGRTRRYQVPADAARTIAAVQTLRDRVSAPVLAGVRRPGPGRTATQEFCCLCGGGGDGVDAAVLKQRSHAAAQCLVVAVDPGSNVDHRRQAPSDRAPARQDRLCCHIRRRSLHFERHDWGCRGWSCSR
ncbi:MAG: hypothetical protein M3381_05110 [Actinomycetota bacterium]|nr:hypothetical protein [Actinomycetota bacterium]